MAWLTAQPGKAIVERRDLRSALPGCSRPGDHIEDWVRPHGRVLQSRQAIAIAWIALPDLRPQMSPLELQLSIGDDQSLDAAARPDDSAGIEAVPPA